MGLNLLLVALASYFLGAIPTGAIVSLLWSNVDVDEKSPDISLLSVWQRVGSIPAAVTVAVNGIKGALIVWAAGRFGLTEWVLPVAGASGVVGCCWSPFLRFRGGKGIAISVGEVLLAMPLVVLTFALTWLGWALAFRHRERAVGGTVMVGPVIVWLLGYSPPKLMLALFLGTVLFIRHASDFSRTYESFWVS